MSRADRAIAAPHRLLGPGQVRMLMPNGTTCWLTVKPGRFRPAG